MLQDVEKFLRANNLSATRFGVLVAGDTKFVATLRNGRKLRAATEARVREWMKSSAAPGENNNHSVQAED